MTYLIIGLSIFAYLVVGSLVSAIFYQNTGDAALVAFWTFWFWPVALVITAPGKIARYTSKTIQEQVVIQRTRKEVKDARKQGNLSYPKQS